MAYRNSKKREREVGAIFESSKRSCRQACANDATKKCRVCETEACNGAVLPSMTVAGTGKKSSKAMELEVAVSLIKPLQHEGIELGALVADDDAATIKRLKERIDVGI